MPLNPYSLPMLQGPCGIGPSNGRCDVRLRIAQGTARVGLRRPLNGQKRTIAPLHRMRRWQPHN